MSEGSINHRKLPAQRYIIERPRLTNILDASTARIILLIAPAGYGKTTLARQWLSAAGQTHTWYRATAASSDVAHLVAGLAQTLSQRVPGTDRAVQTYLRGSSRPDRDVDKLAQLLIDALEDWPDDAWLAMDDYHFLKSSPAAEAVLEQLVDAVPIRFLAASRVRPKWLTARRLLYGEVFELSQDDLALTAGEANSILSEMEPNRASSLIKTARGWPAVVRLAALSYESSLPTTSLPRALHEYFAEELFHMANAEIRESLLRLSVLPTLTDELIASAIGRSTAEVCDAAVELGFLSFDDQGQLELHPLLRGFLNEKLREEASSPQIITELVSRTLEASRWDDAFAIIANFGVNNVLPNLFAFALDDLLESNRLSTLELWVDHATRQSLDFPLLALAEAEIARRQGHFAVGEARAAQAARGLEVSDPGRASQAHAAAASCAYQDLRGDAAARHAERAYALATSPAQKRRALWEQFLAACHYGTGSPRSQLDALRRLGDDTASSQLRLAAAEMVVAALDDASLVTAVEEARRNLPLVSRAEDPMATSGFLHRLAYTALLAGQYGDALKLLQDATEYIRSRGLSFASPHVSATRAAALIGLRHFKKAQLELEHLEAEVRTGRSRFQEENSYALRARFILSTSVDLNAASALLSETRLSPPLEGEYLGLKALVAAATGSSVSSVSDIAEEATRRTSDVQAETMAAFAIAIAALTHGSAPRECLREALEVLHGRGNYDSFVLAYRLYPTLLRECYELQDETLTIQRVVSRARDSSIAERLGIPLPEQPTVRSLLTKREAEVLDLLCEGMTNAEIGVALFISPATVKVHVRHVCEKLGVRTRTQAVLRAQSAD